MPPTKLTVKVRKWGPDAGAFEEAARRLERHPAVRKQLEGAEHRVLSLRLADPEAKERRATQPDRFVATVVDYSNHRSLEVKGSLKDGRGVEVADSARHPSRELRRVRGGSRNPAPQP